MIAMALGLVVLGASMQLFNQAMNATWAVSQRAEMQQDLRAASNLLTQDLSLAGAGMLNANIALASGTGTLPVYGTNINGAPVAYPTQLVSGNTIPFVYGLIPGPNLGPLINGQSTDIVTVVYTDSVFLLNCYNAKVTNNVTATFTLPATPLPGCASPPLPAPPQAIDNAAVGLTPGDLVWFQVTTGTGSGAKSAGVLADVTNVVNNGGNQFTVTFANADALRINQIAATAGNLASVINWTGSGTRLLVTTYYVDTLNGIPRLMRQVSGHTPVPVAENITSLKFTYDVFNNGTTTARQADGGASLGLTPNQITKINVEHLSLRSQLRGTKGYQSLDFQTSVAARDLLFKNDYPVSTN